MTRKGRRRRLTTEGYSVRSPPAVGTADPSRGPQQLEPSFAVVGRHRTLLHLFVAELYAAVRGRTGEAARSLHVACKKKSSQIR